MRLALFALLLTLPLTACDPDARVDGNTPDQTTADDIEFDLVEPLRAFRFVWYAAWIARRWEDPAFPDAFPHFGSPTYWEDETRDLEEQVARLLRGAAEVPPGSAPAEAAEPELSNEEIFWDL